MDIVDLLTAKQWLFVIALSYGVLVWGGWVYSQSIIKRLISLEGKSAQLLADNVATRRRLSDLEQA